MPSTSSPGHGPGSRPDMTHSRLALLVALSVVAAACGGETRTEPAPLDRFVWPTSIAVHDGSLLVVSSNFDLRYDRNDGGSILAVDPAASPQGGATVDAALRIASFAGEVAVADAAACGLGRDEALVPSRVTNVLYRIGLPDGGGLECGAGCEVGLDPELDDPYSVSVVCAPGRRPRVFVGHLRARSNSGWISEVRLPQAGEAVEQRSAAVGVGAPRTFAYDEVQERLFFGASDAAPVATAPIRWLDLAGGCDIDVPEADGGCPLRAVDLFPFLRGAEVSSIALSSPDVVPRRLYAGVRVYDADLAATAGRRPSFDVGGALMVFELEDGPTGDPIFHLVRIERNVGVGVAEVRVLPARPGLRDLVAVTAMDDGLLTIYDDEAGAIAAVVSRDERTGQALLGRWPFALAVAPASDPAAATVYVASFDDSFVTPVNVPLAEPWNTAVATVQVGGTDAPRRIGRER
jgi:hypothetical protein